MPSNQLRDGSSHSSSADAATTDERKPPVTMPVKNSGIATTVTPSRALRLRRSTWKPSTAATAAHPAATIATVRSTSRAPETSRPSPSPGASERNCETASRVSRVLRPVTVSKTVATTRIEPPMIIQPAMVTWRGRGSGSVIWRFHHAGVSTRPSAERSTSTRDPSVTSPEISSFASGSPIAVWINRRSGRAPYAGS